MVVWFVCQAPPIAIWASSITVTQGTLITVNLIIYLSKDASSFPPWERQLLLVKGSGVYGLIVLIMGHRTGLGTGNMRNRRKSAFVSQNVKYWERSGCPVIKLGFNWRGGQS